MKKRGKIAAAAVMILLAAALVYSVCAGTVTVAGLHGAADIDPVKVERIEFIKNRETQQVWRSEDYGVRKSVCDFLNNALHKIAFTDRIRRRNDRKHLLPRTDKRGRICLGISAKQKCDNGFEICGRKFADAKLQNNLRRLLLGGLGRDTAKMRESKLKSHPDLPYIFTFNPQRKKENPA